MRLIFMRHGEALDNVRGILSDREIQCSILTDLGYEQAIRSALILPRVDKIYASPLIRTVQTARIVSNSLGLKNVSIDDRIREINWGIFSGCENNSDLDNTRKLQVSGDFFARFGVYGENKFDIESRLCLFLEDIKNNNFRKQ